MSLTFDRLRDLLGDLASRHGVPGASAAVLHDGIVTTAAHGVLSHATGVETTTDSLFQIGSISKAYTATVVMRLVDEGLVSLDEPVVTFLPEFSVMDPDVTKKVTVRQLLNHTSGIDGDHIDDTGRGDDCLARYVARLGSVGQSHPLGATYSYCNTGYITLGRLIEVVSGAATWDVALRERLIEPLGLTHTVTLPEEALLYRTAVGHMTLPGAAYPSAVPVWGLPRSGGPAGLVCATAADVIAFAKSHLDGGLASDGTRVLSGRAVGEMRQRQVEVPDRWSHGPVHWGLGWMLFSWDGHAVFGHDGGTIGQNAFLRIVPDRALAIALLTNGGRTADLYRDLYGILLQELAGIVMPKPPEVPTRPAAVDVRPYVGTYERASRRIEATVVDGALHLTQTVTGALAAYMPGASQTMRLIPADSDGQLFLVKGDGTVPIPPVIFFSLPDGSRYLHQGFRSTPKVSSD